MADEEKTDWTGIAAALRAEYKNLTIADYEKSKHHTLVPALAEADRMVEQEKQSEKSSRLPLYDPTESSPYVKPRPRPPSEQAPICEQCGLPRTGFNHEDSCPGRPPSGGWR